MGSILEGAQRMAGEMIASRMAFEGKEAARIAELEAENARLREAAAPLAHEAAYWDGTQSGAPEAPDDNLVHVRLNDLRALHRALGPNP